MADLKIKKYFNPTIQLDAMEIIDTEFGSDGSGTEDKNFQLSKTLGDFSPFVMINGMRFDTKLISYFELDLSGFLPKIVVTIQEVGGIFQSKHFPKDGDLISVYMRSRSLDFKSIRNDFRILDIPPRPSEDSQGENNKFTISGILNVPGIHSEKMAYYQGTSFQVLQTIARELGLGFASNDDSTNDDMVWINPADSVLKFVTEDVVAHAYKSDRTFYTAFVDQYYYLNLVEVNSLIVHDMEPELVKTVRTSAEDFYKSDTPIEAETKALVLTNNTTAMDTPNFITKYAPINNSGNISLKNAYRRVLQQYNKGDRSRIEYFIETLTTDGSDDKVILKGREDEDHTQFVKYKYLGQQINDNMHANYLHAMVQNYQNLTELTKVGITLVLPDMNPALYKFQPVPVIIVNKGNMNRVGLTRDASQTNEQNDPTGTMDQFLSGVYLLTNLRYIYSFTTKKFMHQVTGFKRELDAPIK